MLRHAALLVSLLASSAAAEVETVELASRESVLGGQGFGDVGSYELLRGTIRYALDPEHPRNRAIVDLSRAPRRADGKVEAHGDLVVLRPVDPLAGSGTVLFEVSNRGGKAALGYLNRAAFSRDPRAPEHFGDGFLMRRGITVVWVGWQCDVPREEGLLRLSVPVARGVDGPLTGLVRSDWTVEAAADELPLAHRDHVPYPATDPEAAENVLTVRDGRLAERAVVPRERWSFSADRTHVRLEGGFQAGRIYELVYLAIEPRVVGLGLAAIRDAASHARHDPESLFRAERTLALGISQTGRFLRHFLYQGFDADEEGRPVFDGYLIHTAGAGRGSFNHRFAQPSRDGHRYSAFSYPTDLFPFSGRVQRDPLVRRRDGLLARTVTGEGAPKVFYTNTGYEYWSRAAALLHTSLDGSADVEPLANERLYHLASGQHFVSGFPPADDARLDERVWRGNPLDFLVTLRALFVALVEWVEDGRAPPPSAFPRIDAGELVPLDELAFPDVPGLAAPRVAHEAHRVDHGPRWGAGIVDRQPPALGPAFPVLVPAVDALGNERGGVPTVETLAPLATYTPWCLRTGLPGDQDELRDFFGCVAPLARTDDEGAAREDPRPSLASLYASPAGYLARVEEAAWELVERRLLLEEDLPRVLERAEAAWRWIASL